MAEHGIEAYISQVSSQLVRINTENPPGRELEAARYVAERAAELGLKTRVLEHGGGRGSTVAVMESGQPGPVLMFNTHLDTVPIGSLDDWSFHPFEKGVAGGVLYGRGAVDAKGCLASMLAAIQLVERLERGCLVLAAVADEEVGGLGSVQVAKYLERIDYAVLGEPTGLKLMLGNRGRGEIVVEVRGTPAHAATPLKGVNAIKVASKIVEKLSTLERGFGKSHPLLGRNTATVTMISGGVKSNMVAGRCTLTIDFRTSPKTSLEGLLKTVRGRVGHRLNRASVDWKVTSYLPPVITDRNSPLVRAAVKALRKAGIPPRISAMRATTDLSRLVKHHRVDGIILGPGDLSLAHTAREAVPLDELVKAAHVYHGIAVELLSQDR
jgi:acetylornithine deacetylase/succinyl-diaminopimelate desuccinylase family protein